jgi:hypothetical protein
MITQTTPALNKILEDAAQRVADTFIKAAVESITVAVREHPLPSTEEIEGWIKEARAQKEAGK